MSTHHPPGTTFAPDFAFQVALGVLEASDALAARRRPITPQAIARQFRAHLFLTRPTLAQIKHGLTQVQCWHNQMLTRDLLHHRSQLVTFGAQLQAQRRLLDEDQFYLDKMLRETDVLLHNTLTAPHGTPGLATAPGADPAGARET